MCALELDGAGAGDMAMVNFEAQLSGVCKLGWELGRDLLQPWQHVWGAHGV